MIACPDCRTETVRVRDSRPTDWGRRRRYRCANGHTFLTVEYVQERCRAKTKTDKPCSRDAAYGSDYCVQHGWMEGQGELF